MTEKVAISLDRELLQSAERLRKATGETRSALISRALRVLLGAEARARKAEEYVEAYRRKPETVSEVERARALARRSLEGASWDDE